MKVELIPSEYRVHIDWLAPIEKYSDKFAYSVIWVNSQQQWALQITFAHQETHIPSYANKPEHEAQDSCVITNHTWLSDDVNATLELCKNIIMARNPELTEVCARLVPVAYKIKQAVTSIAYFVVYLPSAYAWTVERVQAYAGPVANTYLVKAGHYLANAEDSVLFRKLDSDTALFKTEHEAFKAWKDYVKVAYPASLKPTHQASMLVTVEVTTKPAYALPEVRDLFNFSAFESGKVVSVDNVKRWETAPDFEE